MNANQSIVAQWNETLLEAIRAGSAKPTTTTDQLMMTHAAIFDAWAAYDSDAHGLHYTADRPLREHNDPNKAEAISHAAYAMLVSFFPEHTARFDRFMGELGYETNALTTAARVGRHAAQAVMDARADDGTNREDAYRDTSDYVPVNGADPAGDTAPGGDHFDPNHWQPLRVPTGAVTDRNGIPVITDDPASYVDQTALGAGWGNVTPVTLEDITPFIPAAPPQLGDFSNYTDALGNVTTGDAAYRDQFTAVLEASATLSERDRVIAEYWADGPRTESPPGHWNQIAQDISLREGFGIDDDARLFFALNAAIFDAGVVIWETKYIHDYVRPQSAIRDLYFDEIIQGWGGPNQGVQSFLGQEWQPYQNVTFVTPPFPEFTSGHSGFSMAAANTIASYVGSDRFFDGTTMGNYDLDGVAGTDLLGQYVATDLVFENMVGPPVTLQWETLTEAAQEAGFSRIVGGIHIQDGDYRGREIGIDVAAAAEELWTSLFTRAGDNHIIATAHGGRIFAGPGADTIDGARGADLLIGEGGDDVLRGFGGNDELRGGDGSDLLNGHSGNDILLGGSSDNDLSDTIFGGAGDDSIDAGHGNDIAFGQDGDDIIFGGFGADTLRGQDGNDLLSGGAYSDLLVGGAGDDFLNGGFGHDRISGGAGADIFYHSGLVGHGTDWITGFDGRQDMLMIGATGLSSPDFAVSYEQTPGAGSNEVETFIRYRPTGEIIWVLVDGIFDGPVQVRGIGEDPFTIAF